MLGNHKLVADTFCEVFDLIEPWVDEKFWDLSAHTPVPNAVYLIGRQQFFANQHWVREHADTAQIILSNPHEGSDTLRQHVLRSSVCDLVDSRKVKLISGGDMDPAWHSLWFDSFLPKLYDYNENVAAAARVDEIFDKTNKPYKFLFLNGRYRWHRQQLLAELKSLLNSAIWTNLDQGNGEIKLLDSKYEFDFYQDRIDLPTKDRYVKYHLFNNQWGEIYLKSEPYIDTYFSLVSETVFEYPRTFRTEKIWKPIAQGHPWITAANTGFYKDIRNLGFKTFGHVIDESFDLIENNQDRLNRIVAVVKDLCSQDLASFLGECYTVCKYNQQHLAEMRTQVRAEFPARFHQFLNERFRI